MVCRLVSGTTRGTAANDKGQFELSVSVPPDPTVET